MTTRKITTSLDPVDIFTQRQSLKNTSEAMKKRADKLGARLKDFIKSNFDYEGDSGSRFVDFKDTVSVDGVAYKGMEARRSQGSDLLDLEAAEKFLQKKGLYEEALTPVLDPDKIMLLVQRKKISAKEIDKLMVEPEPTWSLWPVKGEVIE